ncbi:hypothetical protein Bbelb_095230 [Branchiostoma belcheri]|nr:hypothetical protein Bbelb_095230 [Branchiostoma belcheri]
MHCSDISQNFTVRRGTGCVPGSFGPTDVDVFAVAKSIVASNQVKRENEKRAPLASLSQAPQQPSSERDGPGGAETRPRNRHAAMSLTAALIGWRWEASRCDWWKPRRPGDSVAAISVPAGPPGVQCRDTTSQKPRRSRKKSFAAFRTR